MCGYVLSEGLIWISSLRIWIVDGFQFVSFVLSFVAAVVVTIDIAIGLQQSYVARNGLAPHCYMIMDVLRNKSSRLEMVMYLVRYCCEWWVWVYRVGGARGAQTR